jgi:hypothetical protein
MKIRGLITRNFYLASSAWLAVLVALAAGGTVLRVEFPWLFRLAIATDIGVFLVGSNKALDLWGKITDFKKKQLEIQKLEFEVVEKRRAANKEEQLIAVASFEQTLEFGQNRLRSSIDRTAKSGLRIYGAALSLIILVSIGWTVFVLGPTAITSPPSATQQAKPSPVPLSPEPAAPVTSFPKGAARPRNCSIELSDIPRYLKYAEDNSRKGQYERAISEFNQVLACQPGNRAALDGLRRAHDAERYSSR